MQYLENGEQMLQMLFQRVRKYDDVVYKRATKVSKLA
jgi:hypothetical protein